MHLVRAFRREPGEVLDGLVGMARQHEDAHDDAARGASGLLGVERAERVPQVFDGGAGCGDVAGGGRGRARGRLFRVAEVDEGDVAEVAVFLQSLDALVAAGVPDERQTDAFGEERRGGGADVGQVGCGRDEVPVAAAVLDGEGAKDVRELGNGNVSSLAAPAPRRVLAIDALERAAGEEDRARAGLAADGRLLAEVRPPAEQAHAVARAAEAKLADAAVGRAAARAELAIELGHRI